MEALVSKYEITDHEALELLRRDFARSADSICAISEGENVRAYAFRVGDEEFIVRFNDHAYGFKKDLFAHDHFGSQELPIPRTIQLEKVHEALHYSITERARGMLMSDLEGEKIAKVLPKTVGILEEMRRIEIAGAGYGPWHLEGEASVSSWKGHLAVFADDIAANDRGNEMQHAAEELLPVYRTLLERLPESRNLLHGDFGLGNIFSDGENVTAIIDWENSMYGDFLYDVAWASFWNAHLNYEDRFLTYSEVGSEVLSNFEDRVLCYKLHCGLGSMAFFATTGRADQFDRTRGILVEAVERAMR